MKKLIIFLSDGVAFLNVAQMRWDIPAHYEGNWGTVLVALLVALLVAKQ